MTEKRFPTDEDPELEVVNGDLISNTTGEHSLVPGPRTETTSDAAGPDPADPEYLQREAEQSERDYSEPEDVERRRPTPS